MPSDSGRGRGLTVPVSGPVLLKVDTRVPDANECVPDSMCCNVESNGARNAYVAIVDETFLDAMPDSTRLNLLTCAGKDASYEPPTMRSLCPNVGGIVHPAA